MVEGGPRFLERPLLMRRIDGADDGEPDGSDARFFSHPRQGAGVHPKSSLFGFWVPLIYPCTFISISMRLLLSCSKKVEPTSFPNFGMALLHLRSHVIGAHESKFTNTKKAMFMLSFEF